MYKKSGRWHVVNKQQDIARKWLELLDEDENIAAQWEAMQQQEPRGRPEEGREGGDHQPELMQVD